MTMEDKHNTILQLMGSTESIDAYEKSMNREIDSVEVERKIMRIRFADSKVYLTATDEGQSCCEKRYMVCDDDLAHYKGSTLLKIEVLQADNVPDEYVKHEVEFLRVTTSKGSFTVSNHNEHNGYYGGFDLRLDILED